jgi:type III restriction enzyme
MSSYEVPQPILNSPFDPPGEHWHIVEGEPPERRPWRRKILYFYRDPKAKDAQGQVSGIPIELELVNRIRERVDRWREAGYPGVTRTTLELLPRRGPPRLPDQAGGRGGRRGRADCSGQEVDGNQRDPRS